MQIHVINLARSDARRQAMREQLEALGLSYQFFPAVDAKAGDHLRFPNYATNYSLQAWRRPLAPGEVGCFASHYLLWQLCAESNEPMIVMEDDIELSAQFGDALRILPRLVGFSYVRLAGINPHRPSRTVPSGVPQGWQLVRFLQGPMGTQCYVLFPDAARRLLAGAQKWTLPVDGYMDAFWQHNVSCLALLPFVAEQRNTPSIILGLGGFSRPVGRPRRAIMRLWDETQRLAWNVAAFMRLKA